jgi:hypothetical protein
MDMVTEFLDVRQMCEPVRNTLAYIDFTRTYLALAASLRQMCEPVRNTLAYFGLTRNYLALAASLRKSLNQ